MSSAAIEENTLAIAEMSPGSFGGQNGTVKPELMYSAFEKLVLEQADVEGIRELLILDDEREFYPAVQSFDPLQKPALPPANATANARADYKLHLDAYTLEQTAIKKIKKIIMTVCGDAQKEVINERHANGHNCGITNRTLADIRRLLKDKYGNLGTQDIEALTEHLRESWNQDKTYSAFYTAFKNSVQKLDEQHQGISQHEQVRLLRRAVQHIPAFEQINMAFYQNHPLPVDQTLDNLHTMYERYANNMHASATTAKSAGFANQATDKIDHDDQLTWYANELQQQVGTRKLSDKQKWALQRAVSQAITTVLDPAAAGTTPEVNTTKCHKHPNGRHTWAECRQNKTNKTQKS